MENNSLNFIHAHVHVGHRCDKPSCGKVLVLDGNQKNNRPVCAAEDAGFVEYTGLPGRVKTGCMATPEQTSIFCPLHKPRHIRQHCSSSSIQKESRHGVIEMILRKDTRNTTHYEVESHNKIIVILSTFDMLVLYTLHISATHKYMYMHVPILLLYMHDFLHACYLITGLPFTYYN